MTDVALFDGLRYDTETSLDHFFSDEFRNFGDLSVKDGQFPNLEEFRTHLCSNHRLDAVFKYFDKLTPGENRLRWDRLVAFHLLLMAFVNAFGYKRQRSSSRQFTTVAAQIKNSAVLENLVSWIPKHDLANDREAKKIIRAIHNARSSN